MIPELDKIAIGARAKQWMEITFGSVAEACRQLELKEQSVRTNLITGDNLPGSPFLARAILKGLDIYWLFYGKKNEGISADPSFIKEMGKLRKENNELKLRLKQIKQFVK